MSKRKKFDVNGDGKVNFNDFIALLKKSVDTDGDGHVQVNELINAVEKTVEVVNVVKAGV